MTWEGRMIVEASSADPDSDTPQWVDLSSRVRDAVSPVQLNTGRQNDLDQSEPSVLNLTLDNSDDALSYGNTLSVYPWWGPGRRIRYREVIAGTNVPQFDGFISQLTETVDTQGIENRVAVTAIDRLGRLGSSEPFISTHAAHVMGNGGSSLVYYWPMLGDAALPLQAAVGVVPLVPSPLRGTPVATPTNVASYTVNTGTTLPGDDLSGGKFVVGGDGTTSTDSIQVTAGSAAFFGGFVVVGGNLVSAAATVVAWINADLPYDEVVTLITYHLNWIGGTATCTLIRVASASGGFIRLDVTGSVTGSLVSTVLLGTARPYMVAVQVTPGSLSSSLSLWIDGTLFTGTGTAFGGLVVGTGTDYIVLGGKFAGTISHVQLYSTSPTATALTNQRTAGLYGLERQTTGDRIRTIAQYADIPDSQLTQIDPGCSVMQRATLAGQTPLTAMRDAERTEQGLLYCDGNGNLIFKDRRTLYNI